MIKKDSEPTFGLRREMISPGFYRIRFGANGTVQERSDAENQDVPSTHRVSELLGERSPENAASVGAERTPAGADVQ